MKKISVIVITYNQEKYIAKTLQSILMQNFPGEIQLIVANDASTDNTAEIISNCLSDIPKNFELKILNHTRNLGVNVNFASAIAEVKGDYLAICEGDDFWTDKNKLSSQYAFMEKNPEYSICFHNAMQIDKNDTILNDVQFSSLQPRDYEAVEIYRHWAVHTSTVFIRTDVLQNRAVSHMFSNPKIIYSDTPLFMAASLNGKMRGIDKTMSAYRRHEGSVSFGHDIKRDLNQNLYDYSIGRFYSGKIKDISEWLIFRRSRANFFESLRTRRFGLALRYAGWLARVYKKAGISILKSFSK